MVKGMGTAHDGGPLVIVGLTKLNLLYLQDGKPILTPLSEWGLGDSGAVLISYGETHEAIIEQLKDSDGKPPSVTDKRERPEVAPDGAAVQLDGGKFTWIMIPPGASLEDGHVFTCDHSVLVTMNDSVAVSSTEGDDTAGEAQEQHSTHAMQMEVWNTDLEHPGTRLILAARMLANQLEAMDTVQLKVIGRSLLGTLDAALANLQGMRGEPPQIQVRKKP